MSSSDDDYSMTSSSFEFCQYYSIAGPSCRGQCRKIIKSKSNNASGTPNINRHVDSMIPNLNTSIYHEDPFKDGLKCLNGPLRNYIQRISTGRNLEAHLWNCDQISVLYEEDCIVRQMMGNTLKIVATTNLVKNHHRTKDLLTLYSFVGYLPEENIILPVADLLVAADIYWRQLSFLIWDIKKFCFEHKRPWPLCRILITDMDLTVVSAVMDLFNNMDINSYLKLCYKLYFTRGGQVKRTTVLTKSIVCVQFSITQCTYVIAEEVYEIVDYLKPHLTEFVVGALRIVFNLRKISHIIAWFRRLCFVLLTPYWSTRLSKSIDALNKHPNRMPKLNIMDIMGIANSDVLPLSCYTEIYKLREVCKHSPFKKKFHKYYVHCKMLCDQEANNFQYGTSKTSYYCPELLQIIMDDYIPLLPFWSNIMGCKLSHNRNYGKHDGIIEKFYRDLRNEYVDEKRPEMGQFIRGYGQFVETQIEKVRNNYLND